MKKNIKKTAAQRYETAKKLMILMAVCVLAFAAISIYDYITSGHVSPSFTSFICVTSCLICCNSINMKRAKEEMDNEEK